MATTTTRLVLRKPDPTPATGDLVSALLDLNQNWDKVDAAMGAIACTSGARPSTPYNGQFARETDTGKLILWNGTTWLQVPMQGMTVGDIMWIGDDLIIKDINRGNAMGIWGQQNSANAEIVFGSGQDTNLYRGAANQLKTDDTFVAANVQAGDSAWQTPSFQNSWVDYDAAVFQAARYRKLNTGMVVIEGLVKNGTGLPSDVFTLPAGYRPLKEHLFAVVANTNAFARLDILAGGQVRYVAGGNNGYLSINVQFYAEQ